ncbi:MAG: vacuolar iron transporter family protein [Patescibacteria group bacterium]|nr:vacuolar iron transporter family protein [Patescibacteria group bacterium]
MAKKVEAKVLKAAVLGANDGIITTFAVVAGVVGAGLPEATILILGIANMIADGISMALGDYLGEQSARQMQGTKQKPFSNFLHSTSLVTFIAFVIAGTLPLLPYMIASTGTAISEDAQFPLSIISTGGALFIIGSMRTIITKHGWLRSGLEMFTVGALAASVAYLLGAFIEQLIS